MAAASCAAERRVNRTPRRASVWAPNAAESVNVAGNATGIVASSAVRARRIRSADGNADGIGVDDDERRDRAVHDGEVPRRRKDGRLLGAGGVGDAHELGRAPEIGLRLRSPSLRRSPGRGAPANPRRPGCRDSASTGTDSPVSIDWSTITDPDTMRASAGTNAPSGSLIASPGTSSDAGSLTHSPSRRTKAVGASRFLSAASAAPARPSWTKPRVALKRSRPPITAASTYAPRPSWTTIAASSIHGTGPRTSPEELRQRGGASSDDGIRAEVSEPPLRFGARQAGRCGRHGTGLQGHRPAHRASAARSADWTRCPVSMRPSVMR